MEIYLTIEQKVKNGEDVVEYVTKTLKTRILSQSTQDPPHSLRIYSLPQSQKLFNYICDTLVRNLVFYQLAITQK